MIEKYTPSNSRSQLIEHGSNKIILDAYNANPSSMKAAIENFANMKAENKILMLGSMAELGADSLSEHQQIVDLIGRYHFTSVVLVGKYFDEINHPYLQFGDAAEAKKWLQKQNFTDVYVLIKGSRSTGMERIIS